MKKLLLLSVLIPLLAGCEQVVRESNYQNDSRFSSGEQYEIFTDNQTGCKYFIRGQNNYSVMSPLYNEKGVVEGCKEAQK